MTFAERTWQAGKRDDEHMIYEMYQFSQYSDGSVLDCAAGVTYTAAEIVGGALIVDFPKRKGSDYVRPPQSPVLSLAKQINADLLRNAKAALKNGTTTNLARA